MDIRNFLSKLEKTKQTGPDKWQARCPAHQDKNPSLSITKTQEKILIHCHTGCTPGQVVDALGLTMKDLFFESSLTGRRSKEIVEVYPYHDEKGNKIFEVIRFDDKTFAQRRPCGSWGLGKDKDKVKPILYRLPKVIEAVKKGKLVFIAEGEKDVATLEKIDLVATCNPMGAGKWRDHFSNFLKGGKVVILPDNDKPGREHAEKVANSLYGIAREIKILELPNLPQNGDVTNFFNQGKTRDDFFEELEKTPEYQPEKIVKKHNSIKDPWETEKWGCIIPLKTESNLPSFPVESLPEWLRNYVEAISDSLQVPPDLPAVTGLACLSTALAGKYQVTLRYGWNEPCNLYTVTILPPAERKSAVMSAMTKPIYEYEERLAKEKEPDYAEKHSKYRMFERRLQEAENKAAKAGQGERLAREAEALSAARELQKLEKPYLPRLAVSDISPEKMASLLAEQKGKLAVLSSEGILFEIIAGRYSNSPNLDTVLKAHSGDPIRVDRIGRAADIINNPALTIGLTVQPFVLSGLMDNPFFKGRGLLARFLYSIPSPMVGKRNPNPPPLNKEIQSEYRQRLTKLLRIEKEEPLELTLSPAATKESGGFAEYIEYLLSNEESIIRQGWLGKLHGAVARIAALLHLAEGYSEEEPIGQRTFVNAISIGSYFEEHAEGAFGEMGADPLIEDAKHILRWIKKKDLNQFTKNEAHYHLQGRFKKAVGLDEPLNLLEERNYLKKIIPERPGPGRKPSPIFKVNPGL